MWIVLIGSFYLWFSFSVMNRFGASCFVVWTGTANGN